MESLSVLQMETVQAGKNGVGLSVSCAVLMELAGLPWEIGASIANPLAGILVDLGWTAFSAWVCSPKD